MSKRHELKTWPLYFMDVYLGIKTFELRKNDRDFKEGDVVVLQEWISEKKYYTGKEMTFSIGVVIKQGFGLKEGYCAFSLIP